VLYVDSRAATREFSARDLGLFAALSQHIAIALENARLHVHSIEKTRLEHSLELASAIQSGLMPPIPRDVPGIDAHGWYRPAERTSGDFFDFVKTRGDRLAVVVGDVTGHGIGPALVTATAQASLRSYLKVLADPGAAVTMLNQDLSERMDAGMFVTLLVLLFDAQGGVEALNCGHHGPLVWRAATGSIESLDAHGLALGMVDDATYVVDSTTVLAPGDCLLAFTDGLIEAPPAPGSADREDLFGEERARAALAEACAAGGDAESITRALAEAALAHSGGAHDDDITLVVVKKIG
jgi:serine phosphatase RsbU (regulator of sigma subunit)